MQLLLKIVISLSLLLPAHAIEGVYKVVIEKQQQKAQSRWSLGDWLATKQRIALMDQWLALNTEKNLFEMVLDHRKFTFEPTINSTKIEKVSSLYKAKFFITILGFEWEQDHNSYINSTQRYNLSLRFFGTSQQSTHFNFLYGKKKIESDTLSNFEPNFFGFDGDIYLFSFLGASGSFEKLSEESVNGVKLTGESSSYGAFIEIFFLRFYAEKRIEKYFYKGSSNSTVEKDGTTIGVSLYL